MKRHDKGEADTYRVIAEEREPVSFVSGIYIVDLGPQHFAHVLPKSKYPHLRNDPDNIVLLTAEEHSLLDQGTQKQRLDYDYRMAHLGVNVNWQRFFDYKDELLEVERNR